MNCQNYQDLLSDFIDGSLTPEDHHDVSAHLNACGVCTEAETTLAPSWGSVLSIGRVRGRAERARPLVAHQQYDEAELPAHSQSTIPANAVGVSFDESQLATVISTVSRNGRRNDHRRLDVCRYCLGGFGFVGGSGYQAAGLAPNLNGANVRDRYRSQQEVIAYWNERVELNKARWNPEMRETFDKNMSVIDAAVNDFNASIDSESHDEVSEEILNAALNDKVELLKEFAAL